MSEQRQKGAPPGNKRGVKLKNEAVRQDAFRQYLEHVSAGYPREAFFFDHPVHSVCWKTMERYIAENPSEFPVLLMEKAKAARYRHWLEEGKTIMKGGYKGGSPVVWQTIMRNIFRDIGWDREQISENSITHVQRIAESIRRDVRDAVTETEVGNSNLG